MEPRWLWLFSPDGGNGGGSAADGETNGASDTSEGEGKKADVPEGGAPTPASGDKKSSFTQEDVNRIVGERLAEQKRRHEQEQEEARARQRGEWQKLADQRKAQIEELEPKAALAERYAKLLNEDADAQIAEWPDEVKALDPGPDDLEKRMAWIKSARPLAEKLRSGPKAPETEAGAQNRAGAGDDKTSERRPATGYRFQQPGDVTW